MGDRANVCVVDGDDKVFLYTHWGGTELPETLQAALRRGGDRWTDAPYLRRIIVSEMIGPDRLMATTGVGIATHPPDGEDRVLRVDTEAQTVTVGERTYTIPEYVALEPENLPEL